MAAIPVADRLEAPTSETEASAEAVKAPGQQAWEQGKALYQAGDFQGALGPLLEAARAGFGGSEPFVLARETYEKLYGVEGADEKL